MRSILSLRTFPSLSGLRLRFFITINSTPLYNSNNRLDAQDPAFEIVREESVKVYLHMYNGNVQQNPQSVESCVTNPVFEIVQESAKVCTNGNVQQNPLCAASYH